ncbi:structural maintenance of chromosomes protein 5, partial [Phenoliferia sp. Uapishka_3]
MSDDEQPFIKPEPSGSRKPGARRADSEAAPPAAKRARKSAPPATQDDDERTPEQEQNGHLEQDEDEEEEEEDPEARPPLVRDAQGYVVGSIVRIAMKDFLTYDSVEFTPGPYLNMVLGPNGTGKSTIACAIALGLGFHPKVIGRANKLSEFVKFGAEECWIEIELKGLPKQRNAVIRRYLSKDNESSRFTLNGSSATHKDVSSKMEELHVQVNNLCTFLPQDRVAFFAKQSGPELLKETQKAAGDTRLTGWHETLIKERVNQVELDLSLRHNQEELKRREDRQVASEKDVKLYQQRKEKESELAILSILIPVAEYNAAREAYEATKTQKKDVEAELEALVEANKPFVRSHDALKLMTAQFEDVKRALQAKASKATREVSARGNKIEKCVSATLRNTLISRRLTQASSISKEQDVSTIRENLSQLKKAEKEHRATIGRLERDVDKYEQLVQNEPEAPDSTELNERADALTQRRGELQTARTEHESEVDRLGRDIERLKRDLNRVNQEYDGTRLTDIKHQKEKACARWEPDTWKAVVWMREQRKAGNFKGPVYEPARISVSPKDSRLVDLTEAPISMAVFKTFIFELQEDYDYMMKTLNDNRHNGEQLRINGAQLKPGRSSVRDFQGDMYSTDQPISLGKPGTSLNHHEIETSGKVVRYFTPDGSHNIKRSKYGAKGTLLEMRHLGKAKVMMMGADPEKLKALGQERDGLNAQIQELSKSHSEASSKRNKIQDEVAELEREKSKISAERAKLKLPREKWVKDRTTLREITRCIFSRRPLTRPYFLAAENKRQMLHSALQKPSADARREQFKTSMANLTERRVKLSLEHKDYLMTSADLVVRATMAQLRQLQAESDLRAMASSVDAKDQELQEKQSELAIVSEELSRLKASAKDTSKRSVEAMNAADPVHRDEATRRRQLANPDYEQLIQTEGTIRAELDLMQPISAAFIQKHEERKVEIETFKAQVEDDQARLDQSTALLKKVEGKWLPRLDNLISQISTQFSAAFKTLGMTGEIRILKDADYDKWGVEILVSFRDNEALQVLTAQRQSGGERALTTVMYLISLAALAKAPFALVDEINRKAFY